MDKNKSFSLNLVQTPLRLEGMSEIQGRRSLSKVVYLVILDVTKRNRFCYSVQNKGVLGRN